MGPFFVFYVGYNFDLVFVSGFKIIFETPNVSIIKMTFEKVTY